ncbi:hypothetical protein HGRIS_012097 [Hohenbuehelia grisea]|uniref:Uncharacterized protein n=1 Tax=Hohenbuehelia grisea TaxID=104357 RepID=A0ABR3IR76_9AGAR
MIIPSLSLKRSGVGDHIVRDAPPPDYTLYQKEIGGSVTRPVSATLVPPGTGLEQDQFLRRSPSEQPLLSLQPPPQPSTSSLSLSSRSAALGPILQVHDQWSTHFAIPAREALSSTWTLPTTSPTPHTISVDTVSPPPQSSTERASSTRKIWPSAAPLGLSPTNHVSITRSATIRGAFGIDATQRMPDSWMARVPQLHSDAVGQGGDGSNSISRSLRRSQTDSTTAGDGHGSRDKPDANLLLSVDRGHIDVDVYLVGYADAPVALENHVEHGPQVHLKVCRRGTSRNRRPLLARIVSLQ